MRRRLGAFLAQCGCLVACLAAQPGLAQPAPEGRLRLGPLRLSPTLTIAFGVDTNVFNEPGSLNPDRDETGIATAATPMTMRLGPVRLAGKTSAAYQYFRTFGSQNGWSTDTTLRATVPINRVGLYVEGGYLSTIQRQGYEIDVRARRRQHLVRAGTQLRIGGRTTLDVSAQRVDDGYAENESFQGIDLNASLAQRNDSATVALLRDLTPVTQLIVSADWRRDRFDESTFRDADTERVTVGIRSDALIDGQAEVGYRRFRPRRSTVPGFSGVVAAADLGIVILNRTRISARVNRDVAYSFSPVDPYYVLSDVGLTLAQAVAPRVALVARAGRQWLDYRAFAGGVAPRSDSGRTVGGGIQFSLGRTLTLGLLYDYLDRQSVLDTFRYESRRYGATIAYTF